MRISDWSSDVCSSDLGRDRLILERDSLTDRAAVADFLEIAKKEIKRLDDLRIVRACITDTATNAITKLGNDIADNVITPKMRDQFQSEIFRLAAEKVRVEVDRKSTRLNSSHSCASRMQSFA